MVNLYNGNCLDIMPNIPNESIDCCITSPPYWGLRDYGVEGQLGLEPTFELYIEHLIQIFNEVKRVLKKEGTCWVVLGDSYAGAGGMGSHVDNKAKKGMQIIKNYYRQKVKNIPNKSLCQIPSRFAIAMVDNDWILRNKIIWYKRNAMPSSVKDRFTVDYEEVFFFVKNKKYYFEQQLEKTLTKDNSVRNRDITKLNNTPGRTKMGGLKINNYDYKNKRTTWDIPTKPFKGAHFAVFPEKLVKTCIEAGCPIGGVTLDPFAGSGTTLLVAKKLERNFIGIELNKEYINIANERINIHKAQQKLW